MSYTKHTWIAGEKITAERLNALENGIEEASNSVVVGGAVQSVNSRTGVVVVTKADVGLGDAENTSDANKPISTATQAALNTKQATLVSGTNIKTVNGNSVLGSGDLIVEGTKIKDIAKAIVANYQFQNYGVNKESDTEIDIIMFAGQSNSCGRAQLIDNVNAGFVGDVPLTKAFTYNNTTSTTPVKIEEPITINGSSGYGYVSTFLLSYYEATHRRVCACFNSVGGTMLHAWLPYTFDSEGNIVNTPTSRYNNMVAAINYAKDKIVADGKTVGKILLVWGQGESDAEYYGYDNIYANAVEKTLIAMEQKETYYKTHFAALVSNLKTDTGLEKALIIRIGHRRATADVLYQSVINAQNQLGQENNDVCIVSTVFAGLKVYEYADGSTRDLMRDSWHYLLEGYCYAGIEGGLNAGIYVNSDYKTKPVLYEYNTDYLKSINEYVGKTIQYTLDDFLYFPQPHSLYEMAKYAKSETISIVMNPQTYTEQADTTVQLEVIYNPSNATDTGVTFESDDTNIATVDANTGLVTLVAEGTCNITATLTANPEITCVCGITVDNQSIPVTSIELSQTTANLYVNGTTRLNAVVYPNNATDRSVTWESNLPTVATVVDGLVTAVDVGDVIITCRSNQNSTIYQTCSINIDTVPETLLDLDFTQHTIDEYVESNVLSLPASSSAAGVTYDSEGVHWADGAYDGGILLENPISNTPSDQYKITLVMKVAPFESSGTTKTWGEYNNGAILSSDIGSGLSKLQPVIWFSGTSTTTPVTTGSFNTRLYYTSADNGTINNAWNFDANFHTYVIEIEGNTFKFYNDGTLKGTRTTSIAREGDFKAILGITREYSYSSQFAIGTGWIIKSLKVESL